MSLRHKTASHNAARNGGTCGGAVTPPRSAARHAATILPFRNKEYQVRRSLQPLKAAIKPAVTGVVLTAHLMTCW
ncbi:hypothetical protein E2C01_024181 [Portunus trituberculatus]|uniref:Uncharacterized protein n=1 Tax=Portunus trituberculatus TaxID=210409 RepID=A0A5B7EC10_PORTR|nr:hypothetical protein [Portunus trituberculatus]